MKLNQIDDQNFFVTPTGELAPTKSEVAEALSLLLETKVSEEDFVINSKKVKAKQYRRIIGSDMRGNEHTKESWETTEMIHTHMVFMPN